MSTDALRAYLAQLSNPARSDARLWLNEHGQAEGRFFNCALTSAFQPVRSAADGKAVAFEAVVRAVDEGDAGLSLWRMLDQAASDDESVELDRLCRMLHAINFFRQPESQESTLFVSVHNRLLSSVSSNHGYAFRRILDALELPVERIVLQLPATHPSQRWLLGYVTDNYRRNGMRMAISLADIASAYDIITTTQPAVVTVGARSLRHDGDLALLQRLAGDYGVQVVVKDVDHTASLAALLDGAKGLPVWVQGAAVEGGEAHSLARACEAGPGKRTVVAAGGSGLPG